MLWINQWGTSENKTYTIKLPPPELPNVWPTVPTFDPCRMPQSDVYHISHIRQLQIQISRLTDESRKSRQLRTEGREKKIGIMIILRPCQSRKLQVQQTDVNLWVGLSGWNQPPPSSPPHPCPIISPWGKKKKWHVVCRLPAGALTPADRRAEDRGQMEAAGKRELINQPTSGRDFQPRTGLASSEEVDRRVRWWGRWRRRRRRVAEVLKLSSPEQPRQKWNEGLKREKKEKLPNNSHFLLLILKVQVSQVERQQSQHLGWFTSPRTSEWNVWFYSHKSRFEVIIRFLRPSRLKTCFATKNDCAFIPLHNAF